jgi:hypothetical protein
MKSPAPREDAAAALAAAAAKAAGSYEKLAAVFRAFSPELRRRELDLKAVKFAAGAARSEALRGRYRRLRQRYLPLREEMDRVRVAMVETRYEDIVGPWLRSGAAVLLEETDPKTLNAPFVAAGGSPPFHEAVLARRLRLRKPVELAQGQSLERMTKGWFGSWFLPCATNIYYSAGEIRDLAALPDTNEVELIGRFRLGAGVELLVGGAGPIRARDARRVARFYTTPDGQEVGGGGHGGVLQFFLAPDWLGKRRPADVVTLVRAAPIPRTHEEALLSLSRRWREAYGDRKAGRALYAEFTVYRKEREKSAGEDLSRDLRVFDGYFRESYRRQYPRAKPF